MTINPSTLFEQINQLLVIRDRANLLSVHATEVLARSKRRQEVIRERLAAFTLKCDQLQIRIEAEKDSY